MIAEEWRENFRMSRGSLYELANELRPYIEGKTTIMRAPVDVVKQVVVHSSNAGDNEEQGF